MRSRIILACALCAAIGALFGMAEAALAIVRLPWWPLYAWHMALAALLYGVCNALVGLLWAVAARGMAEGSFIRRTAAIGFLSMAFLFGGFYVIAAVFPKMPRAAGGAGPSRTPLLIVAWVVVLLGIGLALLRGRREGASDPGAVTVSRKWVWRLAAGVVLLATLSLVTSWWWKFSHRRTAAQQPPGSERPNVVLIVMDTTRMDALGCYGNSRGTTPNLDRLAAQGVLFEQATVTAPWTLPSHASLFTGLYPSQHRTDRNRPRLADDLTSLSEVFRSAGYQTAGFSNNAWVGVDTNFHQGFDLFEGMWNEAGGVERLKLLQALPVLRGFARGQAAGAVLTNRRINWWMDEIRSPDAPFFLFVNYLDPHFPYTPAEPYRSRFLRPENREAAAKINARALKMIPPPMRVDPGLLAALKDLYEGEVAYLDAALGELMDDLRRRGLSDDTIVVFTSDHGESLGEHDIVFHQFSVHEVLLRVPLILHHPGRVAPQRVSTPVSVADVFPTLVRLAGLSLPQIPGLAGRDLLNLPPAPAATERRLLAEYTAPIEQLARYRLGGNVVDESYFKRDLRSIRGGGLKLVWASDGRHELYDLAEDPWETRNLISERVESAQSLERDLKRELSSLKPATSASDEGSSLDESTSRELRALGYIH